MSLEALHTQTISMDEPCPEAWDRRRRHLGRGSGIGTLERAVRYLVLDQMTPGRVYSPGAKDAVVLLWAAMEVIHADTLTMQRLQRLAAAWLPQHAVLRWQRDQALADEPL